MTWTVLKFGGTSLGGPDRIERAAALAAAREGHVAVVVSALGDTTDRLVDALDAARRKDRLGVATLVDTLASRATALELPPEVRQALDADLAGLRDLLLGVSLLGEVSPATRDLVLSHGERLAARVVAAALNRAGRPAVPVDAREWLVTDDRHGEARVLDAESRQRLTALSPTWGEQIPVVTGFIAATADGRTTTLGRGGSDYTAALLAAHLQATSLEVWTDVPGVFSADPHLVPDAFPLRHMTYGEALELAQFGARVLHPRTLVPLLDAGIPMHVRSSLSQGDPGTLVDARGADDETRATSVTSLEDQALLDLEFRRLQPTPGSSERLHRALDQVTDQVWLATHSAHGQAVSIVVPRAQVAAVKLALEDALERELLRGDLAPIRVREPVAMVTLVAEAMGRTPDVAGRLFAALGRVGVNVLSIGQSATARSISCVVDEAELALAVRTVHAAFHLTHQRVSLCLLGAGTVGGALLRQLQAQADTLRRDHDVLPVLVGVATSSTLAFDAAGLAPDAWRERAVVRDGPWGPVSPQVLDELARLPVPVLVDCTAQPGLESLYEQAFLRGIHVVAANKKALTTPAAVRKNLLETARKAHRAWRYETTVGAALPIVSTLHDLVRTGDVVHRVEGAFSGTLGFLCDQLTRGVPIDDAVRDAMSRGFTEPRPQEDLAGTDAARKALILARELGLELELEDVQIEPLVPADLLDIGPVQDFLAALCDHRDALADRVATLRAAGQKLRYLAVIDPQATPVLRVGPVGVDSEHAGWGLRGSQAFVAFTTDRYPDHPLVVQGAGAGGDVTASGVLADVLRIAGGLRGG